MEQDSTEALILEMVPDEHPDVKVLKLTGPLTIHNFLEFQDTAREQPQPPVLLVDLQGVPYIDSAALGSLVSIHISCEESGHKYALVGANERLNNLFQLTNVKAFLVMFDSVEEALAKLI